MRHVATILPSARVLLFTPLNRALRLMPHTFSLSATGEVRAALLDLGQLITTLVARPTDVNEILPAPVPDYIADCDASAFSAGGVWYSRQCPLPERVWHLQWPADITAAVISESNPTGKLTSSDLEMAVVVLQLNVLNLLVSSMQISTDSHSNNTPSVAWLTKMATKTANLDAAHRLVHGLALRQLILHSAPVNITYYVAGLDNNLADIALRASTQRDYDHAFLTHFNTLFPLQERSWQRASSPPAQL